MASCTAPPQSLMLTHPTSSELSPSLRSFAPIPNYPLSRTFSLYPLVLKPTAKCVHVSFSHSRSSHALVAALAAEVEVAQTVDEDEDEGADDVGSATATVAAVTTKPKTGKAALPLKRDRVSANSPPFWFR